MTTVTLPLSSTNAGQLYVIHNSTNNSNASLVPTGGDTVNDMMPPYVDDIPNGATCILYSTGDGRYSLVNHTSINGSMKNTLGWTNIDSVNAGLYIPEPPKTFSSKIGAFGDSTPIFMFEVDNVSVAHFTVSVSGGTGDGFAIALDYRPTGPYSTTIYLIVQTSIPHFSITGDDVDDSYLSMTDIPITSPQTIVVQWCAPDEVWRRIL